MQLLETVYNFKFQDFINSNARFLELFKGKKSFWKK